MLFDGNSNTLHLSCGDGNFSGTTDILLLRRRKNQKKKSLLVQNILSRWNFSCRMEKLCKDQIFIMMARFLLKHLRSLFSMKKDKNNMPGKIPGRFQREC